MSLSPLTGWGGLDAVDYTTSSVDWLQHFAIDPTESIFPIENRHSDSVRTFERDAVTGDPVLTDHRVDVPTPIPV